MPDQNDQLINQLLQRNQVLGTMGGQQPQQIQPPVTASQPERIEMSPAERELFIRQTGVKSNPLARDINLPTSIEELLKRAEMLMNQYSSKQ